MHYPEWQWNLCPRALALRWRHLCSNHPAPARTSTQVCRTHGAPPPAFAGTLSSPENTPTRLATFLHPDQLKTLLLRAPPMNNYVRKPLPPHLPLTFYFLYYTQHSGQMLGLLIAYSCTITASPTSYQVLSIESCPSPLRSPAEQMHDNDFPTFLSPIPVLINHFISVTTDVKCLNIFI